MTVMAMLYVLHFGQILPEAHLPAPIPYVDCMEVAVRVARYYDHTMSLRMPIVYCEVLEDD